MWKTITVFLLATMFITGTMDAQTLSAPSEESRQNLRQAISKETEKLKTESAVLDVKKIEKMERQTPQKKWDNKSKLIVIGIVVALVGLAVVLALNSRRCIKRRPEGCSFADDINCECVEYAAE